VKFFRSESFLLLVFLGVVLCFGVTLGHCAENEKKGGKKGATVVEMTPLQKVEKIKTDTLVRLAELEAAKQIAEAEYKLAQAEAAVREMRNPRQVPPEPPEPAPPAPIGTAAKNTAVTTVTYRDNTGKAVEFSSGFAKHEEKLADIDRKKSVGVAKAENPGCGWACMVLNPTPWPIGYGGGYYGSGTAYVGGSYGPRPTRFHYSQ
jgi:hypothetical protein